MTTYHEEPRRTGFRAWSRSRWVIGLVIAAAIALAIVLIVVYTGGGGSGGGGGY